MPNPADAEAHLRVIRSLMERSTHYRAISAPGALVGGLLSTGAGAWMAWRDYYGKACDSCEFQVWLIVLALTAAVNLFYVWRSECRPEKTWFSSRALWALRALAPSFILAALVSIPLSQISLYATGLVWSGGYAVGLLAASHFAPKSLQHLGRAFYVATLAGLAQPFVVPGFGSHLSGAFYFELDMAATFGLFHLFYAALTWPRRGDAEASADV
jgi:hypothetical protein